MIINTLNGIFFNILILCSIKTVLNFRNDQDLLQYLQPDIPFDNLNHTSQYLCTRECKSNEEPRICYYQFTLELYTVMGMGCGSCPANQTQCYAPQCVTADGKERMLHSVNRKLPGPSIQVCRGDTIIVDVKNKMLGHTTSIHWHGIRQVGTPHMDGISTITQCPITSGQIFRYKYLAADAGTFFWHSHDGLQKMDGIIGSLVVRQPKNDDPNSNEYDLDLPSHVVLVTDWFHQPSDNRMPGLLRSDYGQDPETYLVNGRGFYANEENETRYGTPSGLFSSLMKPVLSISAQSFKDQMEFMSIQKPPTSVFTVEQGKRYRFRIIGGTCASCPFQFFVERHRLRLVSADMNSLQPVTADSAILTSGERYDFIIDANQEVSLYWILIKGLGACSPAHQVAILRYKGSNLSRPLSPYPGYVGLPPGVVFNPRNGICENGNSNEICITDVASTEENPEGITKPIPDNRLVFRFGFYQFQIQELFTNPDYPHFFIPYNPFTNELVHLTSYVNNMSFVFPPSPLLTQLNEIPTSVFCSEQCMTGASAPPCECLQVVKVPLGAVVEFIIVDDAEPDEIAISHPFHLHGYEFSVMELGYFGGGDRRVQIQELIQELEANPINMSNIPRKDTIAVPASGYGIGRIVADNPGFWFFHCHFIYHLETGMSAVLQVGEPEQFPNAPSGFPTCHEFLSPDATPL